jgi:hypothetical protein
MGGASLPEGFAKLSIVLSAQMTLRDIAQRLVALDEMYETLARLAGDPTIEPLQVGKIETGSFWAWIAGKTKIMAVMSSLLQEKAKQLHWNWRLYGVPRRADAIKEVLDLTKHLKDAGIDVTATREELGHAANVLAKQLSTILEEQPVVTINNTTIVGDGPDADFPLLPNNADSVVEPPKLEHKPTRNGNEADDEDHPDKSAR